MSAEILYLNAVARLRPDQVSALPSLEWLLDPSDGARRSGRSWTLSVAAVGAAMRSGRGVDLVDHVRSPGFRIVHEYVESLVGGAPGVSFRGSEQSKTLWIETPGRVPDGPGRRAALLAAFRNACRAGLAGGVGFEDLVVALREAVAEEVHGS